MSDELAAVSRRLPVYLLLDCSVSMSGDAIQAVQMGIRALLDDLRRDPQALDTVWLSVITFASVAEQVVPLTDIAEFEPITLAAGGGTALGAAIELLAKRMDQEVRKNSPEHKGDWKPLVFILTDGEPNDDWQGTVDRFRAEHRATMVACGAGPGVNDPTLQRIGDEVIRLSDTQPGTLGAFLKWVSETVCTASQTVGTRASERAGPGRRLDGSSVL